jgi:predicted dehydrogenase
VNQPIKTTKATGATRREFLKKTTLAGAALAAGQNLFKTPVYGQTQAPAPGSAAGANNRLVVGFIGVGLQGTAHMELQKKFAADNNIVLGAVCDLSAHRRAEAKQLAGGDCKDYADYKDLLANKDINAVTISTPEHQHAEIAMAALQAGKHIYLEKPMSRYLGEAFALYDTAAKNPKLVFQIGSQGCSDVKWSRAAAIIKAGKIGKLVLGQASYMRNSKEGEWNAPPFVPADWMTTTDLDWAKWQGRAKPLPFEAERYVRWRKYYPYSSGPLGDLCPHTLHPVMLATGNPEFPCRVVSLAQKPIDVDQTPPNKFPERDCPEDLQIVAEFPSGLALLIVAGTVNEVGLESVMRGYRGSLVMAGNRIQIKPERFADELDPDTLSNLTPGEAIETHEKNWFDSIRSDGRIIANGNADLAFKVQTVLSLAEMSNRLNMTCLYDEKTRKITNGDGKEVPAITYGTLPKS